MQLSNLIFFGVISVTIHPRLVLSVKGLIVVWWNGESPDDPSHCSAHLCRSRIVVSQEGYINYLQRYPIGETLCYPHISAELCGGEKNSLSSVSDNRDVVNRVNIIPIMDIPIFSAV